ncbi:MAG: hypothetical protein NAOJABEB_01931 [Steroidobacteraceae bacterium]|nr:hypothetical protein [Steroidobacteraceae bacterium]
MIHILDEIVLDPAQIPAVLRQLEESYLPGLPARPTLSLRQRWASPPAVIPGRPNTLWLLWQVTDEPGYFRMRGSAGPEVAAFWQALDERCEHRRRHVLNDAGLDLPRPLEGADAA